MKSKWQDPEKSGVLGNKPAPQDITGHELLRKAERAFVTPERLNAQKTWKLLTEFILPNENRGWFGDPSKGIRRDRRVYDSCAIQSNRDLASAMQSTITSPSAKWSRIRFKEEKLNEDNQALEWLDGVSDVFHDALNESNFDRQIGRGYPCLSGLGMMILFQDEDFNFTCWSLVNVSWVENDNGVIDTVYRKFKLTIKALYDKFGDKIGQEFLDKLEKHPLEEVEIYHIIEPRHKDLVKYNPLKLAGPLERPYASYYIIHKNGCIVEESGFYEFPVFVARWSCLPDEVYGFGPGSVALPDVRSLNKVREESLKALAKAVNPPIITSKQNMVSGDFRPGGTIVVRDPSQFKEFITQTKFDAVKLEVEDLKNSIKSTFYIDKLLLPPRNETGEMTAYEVSQRLEQMQQILGPVLSRFNSEFLNPLVMRSMNILLRKNRIKPLPKSVEQKLSIEARAIHNKATLDLNIVFVNSLARSQQMSELQNVQQWVQEIMQLAQMKPEALDTVNSDAIVAYSAKVRTIPESMLVPQQQVNAIRQQRQKQQQAQAALQQGQQAGDIAQSMGAAKQAMKPGGGQNG